MKDLLDSKLSVYLDYKNQIDTIISVGCSSIENLVYPNFFVWRNKEGLKIFAWTNDVDNKSSGPDECMLSPINVIDCSDSRELVMMNIRDLPNYLYERMRK